jgi:hypothetical protein
VYADFRHEEQYFAALFGMVLTIYDIHQDDPVVFDLRIKLQEEAKSISGR